MSGLHYVIDVIASLPMIAASLALYRLWGKGVYLSSAFPARLSEGTVDETTGAITASATTADTCFVARTVSEERL